jgi:tetratricopeptide (TPR) repeat protein
MEWRNRKLFWCVFLTGLWCGLAAMADPQGKTFVEQTYDSAKARYQTNPGDAEAAWQFARACFDRADNAGKESVRAATAKEGIAACEHALRLKPNLAAAYYYLGMNQCQLAQTKVFGALGLVREIDKAWKKARELDEHFDFAGPDRNLATLYRDAPRAPLSVGHRSKAEEHALRAVALAPGYPENRLNLIETYIKWDRWAAAVAEDERLKEMIPAARKEFSGPQWQDDWNDWDRRQAAIEKKLRSVQERGK